MGFLARSFERGCCPRSRSRSAPSAATTSVASSHGSRHPRWFSCARLAAMIFRQATRKPHHHHPPTDCQASGRRCCCLLLHRESQDVPTRSLAAGLAITRRRVATRGDWIRSGKGQGGLSGESSVRSAEICGSCPSWRTQVVFRSSCLFGSVAGLFETKLRGSQDDWSSQREMLPRTCFLRGEIAPCGIALEGTPSLVDVRAGR